jgi:hypothetical protein
MCGLLADADAKKLSATLSNLAQGHSGGSRRITPLRPSAGGGPAGSGGIGGEASVAELDEGTKITATSKATRC